MSLVPAVSICIPVHNMARYVGAAIESALLQAFADLEVVVCDDASSDDTPRVVASFQDPRLRYRRFEQRAGQAGSFNRCLAEASGEFLSLLHADDLLLPGFVTDRVARLRADPHRVFVFGAVRLIDGDGAEFSVRQKWTTDRVLPRREILEALLRECVVSPPSLMARRDAALAAGPFRTDLTWGHDWEWMLRLASLGPAEYVATTFAAYRVHDGSGTAEMLRAARNGAQESLILREAFERLERDDTSFRSMRREAFGLLGRRHMFYAQEALIRGHLSVARYNLGWAARADYRLAFRPTFWAIGLGSLGLGFLYPLWARTRRVPDGRPAS